MHRDVFALGQTLCEMLAVARPYELEQGRPNTSSEFNQGFLDWCFEGENPEVLINILKGMCDPNPENRPSAKEAREKFAAWYTMTYPGTAGDFIKS